MQAALQSEYLLSSENAFTLLATSLCQPTEQQVPAQIAKVSWPPSSKSYVLFALVTKPAVSPRHW